MVSKLIAVTVSHGGSDYFPSAQITRSKRPIGDPDCDGHHRGRVEPRSLYHALIDVVQFRILLVLRQCAPEARVGGRVPELMAWDMLPSPGRAFIRNSVAERFSS
jgi:hypothetical protein